VWLLVVILASMPLYFVTLELPKQIVNGPIQGQNFSVPDATQPFLRLTLPYGQDLFGREIELFGGMQLDRIEMLFALCFLFMAAVFLNGWFKLYTNTYKGKLGEQILKQLRYTLLDRVLRYRVARFRHLKGAEVASVIKDEVEPLGEFVGDAFSLPLFLGGQAITGLLFLFLQNIYFGLLTIGIVAFQVWLIPRMRRKLIQLGRRRQLQARKLSGQVAETVDMAPEIHVNDMSNYTRSRHYALLTNILDIRFELYQRKFTVKYINNLLMQFLSFLFYLLGGYFVITGQLDIGQLVAVIAAYKDLPGPIKGLIDYDQIRLMNEARYEQTIDSFRDDGLIPVEHQAMADAAPPHLQTGFELENLTLEDETGRRVVENLDLRIAPADRVAFSTEGHDAARGAATTLAGALARLVIPMSGSLNLDGRPLDDHPERFTGRRIGYVDASTYFPAGTIRDNLTMVLKNRPVDLDGKGPAEARVTRGGLVTHSPPDANGNWIDLESLGLADLSALDRHIASVLAIAGLSQQIQDLGLRGTIDPAQNGELAERIIAIRREFHDNAAELGVEGIVQPFDTDRYNSQATIGENLLFGTARDPAWEPQMLASNPVVLKVLDAHGLRAEFQLMGLRIADARIELFGDLAPDSKIFETVADVSFEEVQKLKEVVARLRMAERQEGGRSEAKGKAKSAAADRDAVFRLAFDYCEAQSRFGVLEASTEAKILAARKDLREEILAMETPPVFFHDADRYNPTASVLDNILLGRIASTMMDGKEKVMAAVQKLVERFGIADGLLDAGLNFEMGNGGRRMTETQRQKLHLARALLKKPDIIILNEALGAMDAHGRREVMNRILDRPLLEDGWEPGFVCVLLDEDLAERFERVLVYSGAGFHERQATTA
jgi:putative ABC transport system ATP-binding protein